MKRSNRAIATDLARRLRVRLRGLLEEMELGESLGLLEEQLLLLCGGRMRGKELVLARSG